MAFGNRHQEGVFLTNSEVAWVQTGNAGVVTITEGIAPSATIGYGKVYVKSSDHNLYFKTQGGTEYQLTPVGIGTVTSVSVVSANGLAGTVATATTTPAITLSTTVTGLLQGNGTAISAASTTGSGAVVLTTSPTIATPVINGLPTGTGVSSSATASTLVARDANANEFVNNQITGYATTVTAAGTTTLVVGSAREQFFTGTTTQTVVLPDATTLALGFQFRIHNNSTGLVTINANGGGGVWILGANSDALLTCTSIGTAAGVWDVHYLAVGIASGKKLSFANSLLFSGTDGSSIALGTGGTVLYSGGALGTPSSGSAANLTSFPTLNQDTTGTAAKTNALNSATTIVSVSSATAPTNGQVLTATSGTAATWQTPSAGFTNPMTTLGDIIYENVTPAAARLAGNTTSTKNFLTQTGTGVVSAAPAWGTIAAGDVPTLNQNTTGTAANATNIGITDDTTTAATMYPLWVTANTGNLPAKVSSTKLTFNPSTATLTTTTFSGALSGNATTATSATTATNATNITTTDDTTTAATYYPVIQTAISGTNPLKTSSTKLTYNPSTGTLSSTTFVGALTGNASGTAANVTGIVALANGGTAANLTASTGGIVYSGASAFAVLAGTATAGQILRSGASAAPTWSTATYPATAGTSGNVLTSDGTNFVSSAPASSTTSTTFTGVAAETINSGNAVAVSDGSVSASFAFKSQSGTDDGSVYPIKGSYSDAVQIGALGESFSYTSSGTITQITVTLKVTGAPVDSIEVGIMSDSAGSPNNTYISSATLLGSSITTSYATYNFTVSAAFLANTTYYIIARRTGVTDTTNYYQLSFTNVSSNVNRRVNSIWDTFVGGTLIYVLTGNISGSIVQAKADVAGRYQAFAGFANAGYTAGQTATVTSSGTFTGLSGLTSGSQYYLTNTAGIISTTAGTNIVRAGVAKSTTSLLIDTTTKIYASGTAYSFTNASALIHLGTQDPTTILPRPGNYVLRAVVNVKYNGASFAANRVLTLKLRRTNNTAADVANSSTVETTAIITTLTYTFGVFELPEVSYTTANNNDIISIYGGLDTAPTAGSLDAVEASIVARYVDN